MNLLTALQIHYKISRVWPIHIYHHSCPAKQRRLVFKSVYLIKKKSLFMVNLNCDCDLKIHR